MSDSEYDNVNGDEDFLDEDPIPAKRDHRIFARKPEQQKKDEDFEEDKFV